MQTVQWDYSGKWDTIKNCIYLQCTVNQCLHFSTVLGAVIKRKQYSGITVESETHVKSVKNTKR